MHLKFKKYDEYLIAFFEKQYSIYNSKVYDVKIIISNSNIIDRLKVSILLYVFIYVGIILKLPNA